MTFNTRAITAACAVALLLVGGVLAVRAQDAAAPADTAAAPAQQRNPDDIVAKVGDQAVTERELGLVAEALESQLKQMAPAQARSILVDTMVSMKLLSLAGRDSGVEETPNYKAQLAFLEMQALRNAYVDKVIVSAITDAEMQEAYKTLVLDKHEAQEEAHARHILVDTKEAAEKVIADLQAGGSFEELAKQSKDPSGQNGGDLGFFAKGQMVPEFETAAFALEPGKYTETPVQSQFGWHVIRLEEKRMSEPPPFESVEAQLRTYLQRQKFDTVLTELRDKYPVEIVGAAEPAAPEATPAPAGEAPAEGGAIQPQN
jgi:peptidyl-prolyl cis-trans isomerase C